MAQGQAKTGISRKGEVIWGPEGLSSYCSRIQRNWGKQEFEGFKTKHLLRLLLQKEGPLFKDKAIKTQRQLSQGCKTRKGCLGSKLDQSDKKAVISL